MRQSWRGSNPHRSPWRSRVCPPLPTRLTNASPMASIPAHPGHVDRCLAGQLTATLLRGPPLSSLHMPSVSCGAALAPQPHHGMLQCAQCALAKRLLWTCQSCTLACRPDRLVAEEPTSTHRDLVITGCRLPQAPPCCSPDKPLKAFANPSPSCEGTQRDEPAQVGRVYPKPPRCSPSGDANIAEEVRFPSR